MNLQKRHKMKIKFPHKIDKMGIAIGHDQVLMTMLQKYVQYTVYA